jgi:hypothetical protein
MWPDVPPPTSLTRMSSRPCVSNAVLNSAFTGASSVTSAVTTSGGRLEPAAPALICRSVSARPAESMSVSTRVAPSSASRSAMARPNPLAAPVTSAIFPATRPSRWLPTLPSIARPSVG